MEKPRPLRKQRIGLLEDAVDGGLRFFRGGKLYITLGSSVIRSQLYFQRDVLVEKMNAFLAKDDLFTGEDPTVGYVKELILK